jgi:hypothetical protein
MQSLRRLRQPRFELLGPGGVRRRRCNGQREFVVHQVPTLPEIAVNLGVAMATVWIGGALLIGGVDRLGAYLRHRRPVAHREEPIGWNPGPAQDL